MPQPRQFGVPALCLLPGTRDVPNDSSQVPPGMISMLMMKERRSACRTIEGWARSVLLETGAIRECEEHGWMKDRADPHARERAFVIARQEPPPGLSPKAAAVAIAEVLESIGDTCPECPPRAE